MAQPIVIPEERCVRLPVGATFKPSQDTLERLAAAGEALRAQHKHILDRRSK